MEDNTATRIKMSSKLKAGIVATIILSMLAITTFTLRVKYDWPRWTSGQDNDQKIVGAEARKDNPIRVCEPLSYTIDDGTCVRMGIVPIRRAKVIWTENKICLDIYRDPSGTIINHEVDNLFMDAISNGKEVLFINEGHGFDVYVRHLGDVAP